MNSCIVILAFNRLEELKRLVDSILNSNFDAGCIDFILSVDFFSHKMQSEIESYFQSINWPYGKKIIYKSLERLGLHDHVIRCGNLVVDYDFLIMLEDDVVVAPGFYNFVFSAVEYYDDFHALGGISLYSPMVNESAGLPFVPEKNEYDVFLIQYAQSWGQAWSKNMWKNFMDWYASVPKPLAKVSDIPENVTSWPESSWKKYFIKYLVEKDKYFIHPYFSFSTNCCGIGTHNRISVPQFQVGLSSDLCRSLRFGIPNNLVKYDVFYERQGLTYKTKNGEVFNLELDIYALKKDFKSEYVVSTKCLPYKILKNFPLHFRPQEHNVKFPCNSGPCVLYKLNSKKENALKCFFKSKVNESELLFFHSLMSKKKAVYLGVLTLLKSVFYKLKM